jgi:uncharacterized protein (TIGR03083 family)
MPSTAELWPLIHDQRAKVAEMLSSLSDAEWNASSLCKGWRVRDVAAHCVETNLMTPARFMGKMLSTGFRFHAMSDRGIATHAQQSPAELLAQYRQTMLRTTTPPGPKVAMLAEAVIHGEDMARPTARRIDASPAVLIAAANFTRGAQPLLHGKTRSAGLAFRATDVEWSTGEGPEVSGPLTSIIIAIAGRKAGLEQLTGDGVPTLSSRL